MRKLTAVLSAFLFVFTVHLASAAEWVVDNSHSNVSFNVSHMVISDVTGKFDEFMISANSKKDDFSDAKINVTIEINSINTENEKRDGHLKSPDFFDAASHPKMTFVSKSIKKVGKGSFKLTGDLTIRGKTKTVTLDVKHGGTINDPWGNTRAGFKITGEIDRQAFGLSWSQTLDSGGLVVGNTVEIVANVELIKKA